MTRALLPDELKEVIDLSKPSLEGLSYMLRHPENWPPGFEWNFQECRSCAMGLASEIWADDPAYKGFAHLPRNNDPCWTDTAMRVFKMSNRDQTLQLFGSRGYSNYIFSSVTPERVATKIDAYLKERA